MLELIIQYLFSPVIIAFCGYMTFLLKENRKTTRANGDGTKLLLRKEIILAHKKYITQGEPMTAFDFQNLQEIHETYKALEGNGLTDKMWEEIKELKVEN